MTRKIIIANWKMNKSFDEAEDWIKNFNLRITTHNTDYLPQIILCPPSIMLDFIDQRLMDNELEELEILGKQIEDLEESELEELISSLRILELGGQDCHFKRNGAFTGDISANMLKDCGAKFVILGHSERRKYHNENNEIISKKISAAIGEDLTPIICIGENQEQRQKDDYKNSILQQLNIAISEKRIKNLMVAYEPIWSIGTGRTPSISEIEEIADLISNNLQTNKNIQNFKILYGGSVNKSNSKEILKAKNVDGLLVGGASLEIDEFLAIISDASN